MPHAFTSFNAREREGLTLISRNGMLKASLAGVAGLTFPGLLRARSEAASSGRAMSGSKSVILLWMAGGPSHIDTWDVKPDAPSEIRGPFGTIPTKLPGIRLCEHFPKQAAMMDRLTILRSVDARGSNHQPNQVFQTGNREAAPRVNPKGPLYPAIGSVVAKLRGVNDAHMPPYVALNVRDRTHFAWGGYLGKQYDPFVGDKVGQLLELPAALTKTRVLTRQTLLEQLDQLRRDLDLSGSPTPSSRLPRTA